MEPQLGDVSDDGYWVLTESGWQATEQQKQALEQGAKPHDEAISSSQSLVTIDSMSGSSHSQQALRGNHVSSFTVLAMLCFGLLMQIIGMHLDSWSVNNDDSEQVSWFQGAEAGIGLTEFTFDCSEVKGIESESGEKNKDMCKFSAGLLAGEFSIAELNTAESIPDLTDDLPDQISAPLSEMCDQIKILSEGSPEDENTLENCQNYESAGSTAIVLFWISFLAGIVSVIAGCLGIFTETPHTNEIHKYSIFTCSFLSIVAFLCWIVMIPTLDDGDGFGSGFYLTVFSIIILVSTAVLSQGISTKATKTFVF